MVYSIGYKSDEIGAVELHLDIKDEEKVSPGQTYMMKKELSRAMGCMARRLIEWSQEDELRWNLKGRYDSEGASVPV